MKRSNVNRFLALFAVSYTGLIGIWYSTYSGSSFQVQMPPSPVERIHKVPRLTPWEHVMQHIPMPSDHAKHTRKNCRYLYGAEHVIAYRDQTELCSGGGSKVSCSRFADTHPESGKDEFGEALCEAINVTIDYRNILKWSIEKEQTYLDLKKQSKNLDTSWWATESLSGTLRGSCNEADYKVNNWTTGHGGQAFLRHSFVSDSMDRAASAVNKHECKFGLKHTLYVIGDKWSVGDNLWHNIEEIMSMFVGAVHE